MRLHDLVSVLLIRLTQLPAVPKLGPWKCV
jgi:hypothetical protein